MDIRQIEFFVAVAEELNFTRAAERTHVTQSGLSASIRSLERELRHRLFERTPRSVGLTPAGHAFLPRARRILADSQAALRELDRAGDAARGSVSLGAEQCLGDLIDLPDVVAAFRTRHPACGIRFEQRPSRLLIESLRRGELDLGLIAGLAQFPPPTEGHDVTTLELASDRFELLVSPEHPLADAEISWPALEGHDFVDLGENWTARRIVDEAFRRRRLSRTTAFTADDVHMLLSLIRRGLGAGLVPASYAAKPEARGLVRRAVPDADLTWTVQLVKRADAGRTAELFADMLVTADLVSGLRVDIGGDRYPEDERTVAVR
ncbi:LysR family transcriptional regulator [Streptomyces sp. NPDC089424]|uniref:LysR family transcriptional regulator n=1 Tax=Streptomyces sp. NPDC089424 TaxID=3365917 RepID=UPI0037F37CBA